MGRGEPAAYSTWPLARPLSRLACGRFGVMRRRVTRPVQFRVRRWLALIDRRGTGGKERRISASWGVAYGGMDDDEDRRPQMRDVVSWWLWRGWGTGTYAAIGSDLKVRKKTIKNSPNPTRRLGPKRPRDNVSTRSLLLRRGVWGSRP